MLESSNVRNKMQPKIIRPFPLSLPLLLRSESTGSTVSVREESANKRIDDEANKNVALRLGSHRARTVTWSKKSTVRRIPGISHLSEEERTKMYYRPEDTKRIQEDILETCFLMNHGGLENDEEFSFRGLERRRDGEMGRTKLIREMVIKAVIESSKNHPECPTGGGVGDDVMSNIMYRSLTMQSTREALERAEKDARAILSDQL